MWTELEVKRSNSSEAPRRIPLAGKRVRVGSSLRNDIILLDRSIPARAGEFQKVGLGLKWHPDGSEELLPIGKGLEVGPYQIRVRQGKILPSILMVLLFSGVLYEASGDWFGRRKNVKTPESREAVELPAKGPFMVKKEAAFQFEAPKGESFLLHYSIGNAKGPDTVSIFLNGKEIAFAPPCENRWAIEERLPLHKSQLKVGMNALSFLHRDKAQEVWGARDIYLTKQTEEMASPDDPALMAAAADKLFRLRASRPGQLVRARQLLDRAIGLFKAQRGSVPKSAIALQWEISRAAETLVSDGLSEAKSAISLGDRKKALAIYEQLLDELVDPADPRKQEVLNARKEVLK